MSVSHASNCKNSRVEIIISIISPSLSPMCMSAGLSWLILSHGPIANEFFSPILRRPIPWEGYILKTVVRQKPAKPIQSPMEEQSTDYTAVSLPDFDCGATEWHELNDCRWDIDWCNCSGTVYTALLVLRSIALAWFSLLLRTVDSTRTQYVQFVLCIVIDNYTANVKATSWTIRLVKHAESPCANQVLMKLLKAFIVETDKRMYTFLPFS